MIPLKIGIAINTFAKNNSFVAIKTHKDVDPIDKSIIRRRTYRCWKAGITNPKKVEDITLHRDYSCLAKLILANGKSRNSEFRRIFSTEFRLSTVSPI